jgi:hypothetical protein
MLGSGAGGGESTCRQAQPGHMHRLYSVPVISSSQPTRLHKTEVLWHAAMLCVRCRQLLGSCALAAVNSLQVCPKIKLRVPHM